MRAHHSILFRLSLPRNISRHILAAGAFSPGAALRWTCSRRGGRSAGRKIPLFQLPARQKAALRKYRAFHCRGGGFPSYGFQGTCVFRCLLQHVSFFHEAAQTISARSNGLRLLLMKGVFSRPEELLQFGLILFGELFPSAFRQINQLLQIIPAC